MSSFDKNEVHDAILQYSSMPSSEHAHTGDCTTKLHFDFQEITLPSGTVGAFVAKDTPFAFHLAPDSQHYQVSHLRMHKTLDIAFDHYQECEQAIALFCQTQEVAL